MASKGKDGTSIDVVKVEEGVIRFCIIGRSPFVCNAMSAKVKGDLINPPQKKNNQERATTLKHDPMEEYRRSPYRAKGDDNATRIVFPSSGFKRAMASAALELPGTNKTQIGRLCWAEGQYVSLFGIPQMWMAVVRQAGMNKTPDIRTRAILPEWACEVVIRYVTPNLREQPVVNLMASAGVFIGVGDGRPEKGALSFGQFEIVAEDDERFQRIRKVGGLGAQDQALEHPTFFDVETEELYEWWRSDCKRRGFKVA